MNNKQLLDKAMVYVKIYSVETSNIWQGLAQVGYLISKITRSNNSSLKTNTLFQIIE